MAGCFFWRRSGDSNPGAGIHQPNGLANRPLRPAWVLLQSRKDYLIYPQSKKWRRERDSNPCGVSPKRFSRPPRYDRFGIPPNRDPAIIRCFHSFVKGKRDKKQKKKSHIFGLTFPFFRDTITAVGDPRRRFRRYSSAGRASA